MPPPQRPATVFARNLQWFLRHVNGDTLAKIAADTGHTPATISRNVNMAAEALIEHAQHHLMEQVFPLATELWREAVKAEIVKAKKGEKIDFALIDRLLKGLQILDRPQPTQPIQQAGQLTEGFDTLAGFVASRATPPRIADIPSPPALVAENIIEGDVEKEPTKS